MSLPRQSNVHHASPAIGTKGLRLARRSAAPSPIFAEFYKRADAPYSAGAFFDQFDGSGVGVGVLVFRGRSQGPVDAPSAHGLGSLLPHLRSALRVRVRLDDAAQAIAVGAMEALRQIVILCNRSGRVIACTGGAEEVLRAADPLRIRSGRLEASDTRSNGDLQAAIRRAVSRQERQDLAPASSSILLMSRAGRPTVADVVPLPADCFDLRLGGVVLVSLPTPPTVRSGDLLKRAYGLTQAEADVCRRLVDGDRVADIAAERQVTPLTVRNQIKAVFARSASDRKANLYARSPSSQDRRDDRRLGFRVSREEREGAKTG